MANVAIGFDCAIPAGKTVQNACVLHVATIPDLDSAEVASKYGIGSDEATPADDHVPDQYGGGMNPERRINDRHKVFERITGHVTPAFGELTDEDYRTRARDFENLISPITVGVFR